MNKSTQYNQQTEPEQCKSDTGKIYLPKLGTWPSISQNMSESGQIKE